MRRDDWDFFWGLVWGAMAGSIAALFLLPKSGEETREQLPMQGFELTQRADDLTARAQQVASEAVAKVQSGVDTRTHHGHVFADKADETAARVGNAIDAAGNKAADSLERTADATKETLDNAADATRKAADKARDRLL